MYMGIMGTVSEGGKAKKNSVAVSLFIMIQVFSELFLSQRNRGRDLE